METMTATPCADPQTMPRRETFDEMWARAITLEEFRQRCYKRIREIYGED